MATTLRARPDHAETRVNVLHISESDAGGGAARSAYALHRALRGVGSESRMLVGRKLTADPAVRRLKRHAGWRAVDRLVGAPLDRLSLQYALYPSSFGVIADRWFRAADVVQLHNTHGSFFSHTALPLLTRLRPTVWLLHDMWPLTGHVAYSLDCERWRHGCGACPYLGAYPALRRDTSALLWRLKSRVYRRSRLTVVAPSLWLAGLARESPLLGGFPAHHIPYGIDLTTFSPAPKGEARDRLALPAERQVVLFAGDTADPRKGFLALEAAVRCLDRPPLVVVAGRAPARTAIEICDLGTIQDDKRMADAYRAADLFVLPTQADNLPNALLEAAACGIASVAFAVGGVPEVVRHFETGYLAPAGDVPALAEGIRQLLDDAVRTRAMGVRGRELAEREFGEGLEAARYLELYRDLLER